MDTSGATSNKVTGGSHRRCRYRTSSGVPCASSTGAGLLHIQRWRYEISTAARKDGRGLPTPGCPQKETRRLDLKSSVQPRECRATRLPSLSSKTAM